MKRAICTVAAIHALLILQASSFTIQAQFQSFISSLLTEYKDPRADAREVLKKQLLEECSANFGRSEAQTRVKIESLIYKMAELNPTKRTANSPLLMKDWDLVWTTEKEINYFIQNGISNKITQTISDGVLENYIPFVKGGGFRVIGQTYAAPDDTNDCRTEFVFTEAKLDLAKWGTFDVPPIGKGWFDTIYLDDELRIDSNSRNDILICTAKML